MGCHDDKGVVPEISNHPGGPAVFAEEQKAGGCCNSGQVGTGDKAEIQHRDIHRPIGPAKWDAGKDQYDACQNLWDGNGFFGFPKVPEKVEHIIRNTEIRYHEQRADQDCGA